MGAKGEMGESNISTAQFGQKVIKIRIDRFF